MKLAFTGAHSTGKTTLVKELSNSVPKKYTQKYVTEVARKIIDRGYPLGDKATEKAYLQYISSQLEEERDIENYDLFVSDRTLLDPLAYMFVNKELFGAVVSDELIRMMENIWIMEQKKYDWYVYFPVEFPLVEDGIRPIGNEYQKAIDDMIHGLLCEHKIPYITISGSVIERKQQIMDFLRGEIV